MHLRSNDWFADAEIIIRARELGLTIGETPVHFRSNDLRGSFVKPAAIFEFTANLLRYRFFRSDEPEKERRQITDRSDSSQRKAS